MKTSLLLFLFLLLAATSCTANQGEWRFGISVGEPYEPGFGIGIGTSPTGSDNYDPVDNPVPYLGHMNMGIYHAASEGWTGSEGFYDIDFRSPVVTEKTWDNIYYWYREPSSYVTSWYVGPLQGYMPPSYYRFTLYLDQVPQGVTYNGPWSWQLSSTSTTQIAAGTFPPFASTTGLDAYKFHLTVVAPEPSSFAALAGGLAGICGMMSRRRRG